METVVVTLCFEPIKLFNRLKIRLIMSRLRSIIGSMIKKPIIHICIPNTHRDYFDYYAENASPALGTRVWVPFGTKKRMGIVVGYGVASKTAFTIKTITETIDDLPILPEHLLKLCQWVSRYYHAPLSEVIPLALPKHFRLGKPYESLIEWDYQLALSPSKAHAAVSPQAKRQHELIDLFSNQSVLTPKSITEAGFSTAQRNALLALGVIQLTQRITAPVSEPRSEPLHLNTEQAFAVKQISEALHAYQCFLIEGVTGSGKTEVYLQVIAQVLNAGKQVLVIVPEIGLTPQLLSRFSARFNDLMRVLHSNLSDTERRHAWQLAKESSVKLIIGTRGAIFTPMPNLGLIVIDEEHDASLKQIDRVRYSARDTALMRAHMANIPIVLGSATPSLESLYNCQIKKYTLLRLTQKAVSQLPLRYQLLDIRNETLIDGLAHQTIVLIREHLERQQQVLVFINRRGFSPVLLCHECGWMADCRACDSHLTVHRTTGKLACHHCGLVQPIPSHCAKCKSRDLVPIGAGTQRIYDVLKAHFPTTNILRIDRDEITKKQALNECLDKINRGEAQLIVGTQMLAKGHHFPKLTLVIVVDADSGFYNQDFRATERLGQLLTQVAGRAGRENLAGHVMIQTHLPQHPLLNLLVQQGYGPFAQNLLTQREQALLPPYSHLAMLRAQSKTMPKVLNFLHAIKKQLQPTGIELLGPAHAPLARKADHHRMQLLIKSATRQKRDHALNLMHEAIAHHKLDKSIDWAIDVDPIDLA
jgi:primosomal protein N' (replication factor Y)